ncbi:fimbrial biogenesis chaperone [Klebsiella huaxiensis]|uniref:Putative fimbrial chaperone LpfB n=1 Tax=Klebsiella huaxiensis TaxID=2153354 RepID=A0A564GQK3_9ENTR|nr:molecular chaperone [Klebsiella huaxiensis]VUS23286.1 putative fimbrial chaperone LpfB [Klebsiella huaxiensis]
MKRISWSLKGKVALLLLTCISHSALSAVRPQLTRAIAYAADKETAVEIINDASNSYMIQSWMEDLNGRDDNIPIVLTPPVMKLNGGNEGKLRLVVIPSQVPQDRESVYWLNIQEIPPKSKASIDNKLVIAIRSRMKVFVRPVGFNYEDARDAVNKLTWSVEKEGGKTWLKAKNNSAYYISFGKLALKQGTKAEVMLDDKFHMPPPFGSQRYEVPQNISGSVKLIYSAVHDYGGAGKEFTTEVNL